MEKKTYIVKNKDYNARLRSRSGGFFFALATMFLQNNGVVYGCAQNECFEAEHIRVTNNSDLPKLAGSKYIQSVTGKTFLNVKKDLQNGVAVLYSGTGCQIGGLLSFLRAKNIDTNRLLTIDIVCHGVPSPEIWRAFLQWAENKYSGKVTAADYRDKRYGWSSHFETLTIKNRRITFDYYKEMFYKHYTLRPSCYKCPYCNLDRVGDVTIADAWGIDYHNADFNDDKGCSLVIINTNAGADAFESVKQLLDWRCVQIDDFMQPNLRHASSMPNNRDAFWDDYYSRGFSYISKKYGGNNIKGNIKARIKKCMGRWGLTRFVKGVMNK